MTTDELIAITKEICNDDYSDLGTKDRFIKTVCRLLALYCPRDGYGVDESDYIDCVNEIWCALDDLKEEVK